MKGCVICKGPMIRRYTESARQLDEWRTCSVACAAEWKQLVNAETAKRRHQIEAAVLQRLEVRCSTSS